MSIVTISVCAEVTETVLLLFPLFTGNGLPTLPMESMSSGLSAMIHGQGKASRSAQNANATPVNVAPTVTSVPVIQSTPAPVVPLHPPVQEHVTSNVQPSLVTPSPSNSMMSSSISPSLPNVPVNSSEVVSSGVAKQGLFPSQITSLPGAIASQMQGQMSQLQQQVTQVGGSLISQTQDQMSSLQSQMASIPSALGSLVPSGLVPQRLPVSTVSPSIVTPLAVTSPPSPSVIPSTTQLPIAVQSQ